MEYWKSLKIRKYIKKPSKNCAFWWNQKTFEILAKIWK